MPSDRLRLLMTMALGAASLVLSMSLFTRSAPAGEVSPPLSEGQVAPEFTLLDQNGKQVKLQDHRGQWVVVYFYPRDDTPGCTKEACSFRDNLPSIQQLDAVVLGISVDSAESHQKFAEKYELNFSILSDTEHKVCNLYGTLTEFRGIPVARRSTFLIDPEGVIRKIFPSVKPKNHAIEVHQVLQRLKQS